MLHVSSIYLPFHVYQGALFWFKICFSKSCGNIFVWKYSCSNVIRIHNGDTSPWFIFLNSLYHLHYLTTITFNYIGKHCNFAACQTSLTQQLFIYCLLCEVQMYLLGPYLFKNFYNLLKEPDFSSCVLQQNKAVESWAVPQAHVDAGFLEACPLAFTATFKISPT